MLLLPTAVKTGKHPTSLSFWHDTYMPINYRDLADWLSHSLCNVVARLAISLARRRALDNPRIQHI